MRRIKESFVDKEFDRLTVTAEEKAENGDTICICDCECGRTGVRVAKNNIRSGATGSCGCKKRDMQRRRMSAFGDPEITRSLAIGLREKGFSCRQIGRKIGEIMGRAVSGQRVHQILLAKKLTEIK